MKGGTAPRRFLSKPALVPWSQHWSGRRGEGGPQWNLYCGDATQVLGALAPDRYACVLTSPPYYWQRDYKTPGQIGLEPTVGAYVNSISEVMDGVRRVLHPKGVLFLNLGDTYYSGKGRPQGKDRKHNGRRLDALRAVDASGLGKPKKTVLGMPWRVALEMIDRGWILRSPIIWRRENAVPEPNALDRPWRTYEYVFMFSKGRSYDFNRAALEDANVEDVWTIESQSQAGREHPAVFPPELVRLCLGIGNPRRGPVLDPFSGSATVLLTSLEMGSDADGIDLNSDYCRKAASNLGHA
jgi:DNA modification methylase